MRTTVPAALLAVALSVGLAACGSSSKLLPAGDAAAMDNALANVADATSAGDCPRATQALREAQQAYARLPASVDPALSARIREGLARLANSVPNQCRAANLPAGSGPSTGTSATAPTSSSTTTTTTGTTTTTTPTTTTTTPTTTTTTPTTTTTQTGTTGNPGGVSPDQTTTAAPK
jgi:hypothetical protein